MNVAGCNCAAPLLPSGDDVSYCSKCGMEYRRGTGLAIRKVLQLHGPLLTASEAADLRAELAEMRGDDEQNPETD